MDNNCDFNIDEMVNAMNEYAPLRKPRNQMSSAPSGGPLSLKTIGIIALILMGIAGIGTFVSTVGLAVISFIMEFLM